MLDSGQSHLEEEEATVDVGEEDGADLYSGVCLQYPSKFWTISHEVLTKLNIKLGFLDC